MREDRARQRQARPHQHRRPVDGVRGEDVLADQVQVGRPVGAGLIARPAEAERAVVVEQGVEPDVADVVFVERQRDPPAQARLGPADAEVAEGLAQEAEHLVGSLLGHDEARVGLDVVDQGLLVLAHAEEVVLLADGDHGVAGRALAVQQLLLGVEALLGDIVPALVVVGVDLALGPQVGEHALHHCLVLGHRRADVEVVADAQPFPDLGEARAQLVAVFLRAHAPLLGRLLHLLAVLVRAGQKERRVPEQAVVAREHVGQHRRVGVAQVRLVVDVVNWRGNVEARHGGPFRVRGPRL